LPRPSPIEADPAPRPAPTNADRWPVVPRIDSAMKTRLRAVFEQGQADGNDAGVVAKVGDSITVSQSFLVDVGCGEVNLSGHSSVLPAIAAFTQSAVPQGSIAAWCGAANSFTRSSVAAAIGWSAGDALRPFIGAPPDPACNDPPYDAPLPCELHLIHPAVAVIMFGTNDSERSADPAAFAQELHAVIGVSIASGVIPILSTIPPRPADAEMDGRVRSYN